MSTPSGWGPDPWSDPDRPAYGPPGGQPGPPSPPGGQPGYGQPGYGQPGYGQPGSGQPPERPTSNRRVLILVGVLAVAAVLLVGAVAAVALRGGNPREAADEFMAALQAKDVDKAHSLLCRDGKEKESKDELREEFDLDDRTITAYQLGTERTRQREGKEETLIPVTVSYDQGGETKLDLGVWNEGGQKICSLNPPGAG